MLRPTEANTRLASVAEYNRAMNTAKQEVMQLLETLPETASFEDIQYHLYVRQKVEHGLEDAAAGRTLTEEEFDQRMARWLEP